MYWSSGVAPYLLCKKTYKPSPTIIGGLKWGPFISGVINSGFGISTILNCDDEAMQLGLAELGDDEALAMKRIRRLGGAKIGLEQH